jgi:hypothetical protein
MRTVRNVAFFVMVIMALVASRSTASASANAIAPACVDCHAFCTSGPPDACAFDDGICGSCAESPYCCCECMTGTYCDVVTDDQCQ